MKYTCSYLFCNCRKPVKRQLTYSDGEDGNYDDAKENEQVSKKLVVKWPHAPNKNRNSDNYWRGRGRGIGGAVRGGAGLPAGGGRGGRGQGRGGQVARGGRGGRSGRGGRGGRGGVANVSNEIVNASNGYNPPSTPESIEKENKNKRANERQKRNWDQEGAKMTGRELSKLITNGNKGDKKSDPKNNKSKEKETKPVKTEKTKVSGVTDAEAEAEVKRQQHVKRLTKKIQQRELNNKKNR